MSAAILNYNDPQYQRFNMSLDENGEIQIAGFSQLPSRILFEMDKIAYEEAYTEFQENEIEELKEIIYDQYPSLIAYNFRQSQKGPGANDPVRKLLHLKDAWEAIVFVLYAIVMGEIRARQINLSSCQVFHANGTGGNPIYLNFNSDKLLSDAIKQKIHNIKAITNFSKTNNLGLLCEAISEKLLDLLLNLQDIRNDISHHAAPTKEQAEIELLQINPLFNEMLLETRFLENCKIFRFESFSNKFHCEIYNGHHLNKEYCNLTIDLPNIRNYILSLGNDQLFVGLNDQYFSISPFIHFINDVSGHESFICFYKKRRNGLFWYEPLKIRQETNFPSLQYRFDQEKTLLINLLVP